MNSSKLIVYVLILFFFTTDSFGVEHHYYSSWKVLPEKANADWTSTYSSGQASIVTDDSEGDVLSLNHTVGNTYACYTYDQAPGSGTISDIVVINTRLRLTDATQSDNQPQFTIMVERPRPDRQTGRIYYIIRLAKGLVEYRNGSSSYSIQNITLNTDWHDVRYVIDVSDNTAKLYIDGATMPVVTHCGVIDSTVSNQVMIGDFSGSVSGKVNISSFCLESYSTKVKNSYKSAWNNLPEIIDSNWIEQYDNGQTTITNDGAEGNVLSLNHTTGNAYACYIYNEAPGSGTMDDLVIINTRFRLTDATQSDTQPQFAIMVARPRPDLQTGRVYYTVRFALKTIEYRESSSFLVQNADLGTDWHDARYIIDVKEL